MSPFLSTLNQKLSTLFVCLVGTSRCGVRRRIDMPPEIADSAAPRPYLFLVALPDGAGAADLSFDLRVASIRHLARAGDGYFQAVAHADVGFAGPGNGKLRVSYLERIRHELARARHRR